MNNNYDKYMDKWNNIFVTRVCKEPNSMSTGNESFDKGIAWAAWACSHSEKILDFGCGNGTILRITGKSFLKENLI